MAEPITIFNRWRRRRRFARIRRHFADCGLPVDRRTDSELEAALGQGGRSISDVELNAKLIYLAARKMGIDGDSRPRTMRIKPLAREGLG